MMNDPIFSKHQRQVHLDFHTSPYIPDVGAEFDATEFASTMQRANVNSVTVFAKCHHGMCYYPTRTGISHPAIGGRDLLGEQIEALHRVGIRAPIYTTIVWEDDVARRFPQWRQMTKEGHFAGWGSVGPDGLPGHVATWQFNDFLHPEYQDYFEAHVREICQRYGDAVDGFFFDILFYAPNGSWSEPARLLRRQHGLHEDDRASFDRFQGLAQAAFTQKFTAIVHGLRPQATIFYNTANDGNMHPQVGPRVRAPHMTHFEIESLPSGFWGYFHFPRLARAMSHWGKPWLGMTGRFQKMWGDFGGIKPQPALEFECFRAQALGGANSIGDQLPPRGRLDPAAYALIGAVFGQCAEAEPFYAGAEFLPTRIGIFSPNYAGLDGAKSEEGAVLLCEEAHYDCAMLDGLDALDSYSLIIIPDSTVVNADLAIKLKDYHANGGKLLISHRGGFGDSDKFSLDWLGLEFAGEVEDYPTYWRAQADFAPDCAGSDRVFYQAGMQVSATAHHRVLVDRVLPYFKRSAIRYSSHFQTPPVAQQCAYPAVIAGERFIYFADPIFREYRQSGNIAVRDIWQRAMRELIGTAPFGAGLPPSVLVYPLKRGNDLILTLLRYIPVRKAMDIDVIDERGSFAGEILRLPTEVQQVRDFISGDSLQRIAPGEFALPAVKGRLLLEVPGFFA